MQRRGVFRDGRPIRSRRRFPARSLLWSPAGCVVTNLPKGRGTHGRAAGTSGAWRSDRSDVSCGETLPPPRSVRCRPARGTCPEFRPIRKRRWARSSPKRSTTRSCRTSKPVTRTVRSSSRRRRPERQRAGRRVLREPGDLRRCRSGFASRARRSVRTDPPGYTLDRRRRDVRRSERRRVRLDRRGACKDLATAHRAAGRLESGYVWINSSAAHFHARQEGHGGLPRGDLRASAMRDEFQRRRSRPRTLVVGLCRPSAMEIFSRARNRCERSRFLAACQTYYMGQPHS